jgi:hypothetical protein
MPKGRPFHTQSRDEFLTRLRSLTNARVVPDKQSSSGYRIQHELFAGWKRSHMVAPQKLAGCINSETLKYRENISMLIGVS